jgi:hypothetical protein
VELPKPKEELKTASSSSIFRQQIRRDRIRWGFLVPDHRKDPPALAVKVELENIHAARDHFSRGCVLALLASKHRGDISVTLNLVGEFAFGETFSYGESVGFVHKFLMRGDRCHDCAGVWVAFH